MIIPSNPWFESESGQVEFVVFQAHLETVWHYASRAFDHVAVDLRDLQSRFEEIHAEAESAEDGLVEAEELGWAAELFPKLAFGGSLAAAVTALEVLLSELCRLAEDGADQGWEEFRRQCRFGGVEAALAYLKRHADVRPEFPPDVFAEFDVIRAARNRYAHELGAGSSEHLLENVEEIAGVRPKKPQQRGVIPFSLSLVEAALGACGAVAAAVETAWAARRV